MKNDPVFLALIMQESRRRLFGEGVPRLEQCLEQLTEAEIWYRPNEQSNSVGNLVLHLCGNVRQWIGTGLGKKEDTRQRSGEFSEQGPLSKAELLKRLADMQQETEAVFDQISVADLLTDHSVQGFRENGIGILIHVVEHFSYHVGQVVYFVKSRKATDMGFYKGIDLEAK
ncbi:MAG: hypothetical protein DHS20C18_50840 [Saprospiraceae bacterium]|nr:MAG: hypothetical protein DHS20C18_50840 [Saprospiraceae bacterium]